jgi:hypothetical protein
MNYNFKILLISLTIIVILVYIYIANANANANENANPTLAPTNMIESFEIKETNKVIELLRDKYKQYETIEIPISITNYGRNCMNWQDTNNPAFAQYTGNKCIAVSKS